MEIAVDRDVDAAYIRLVPAIAAGEVATTVPVAEGPGAGLINLDFDANGALLGIEVLNASALLRPDTLGES